MFIALISPPVAGPVQAGGNHRPSTPHPKAMQVDRLQEFFSNNPGLCMAFIAILGGIAWTFFQGSPRGVRKLSPSDATRLINHEDAVIVDVRSDGEFRQGHIVNALNIPESQLAERLGKLNKYRSRPIITTCRTGQISIKASGKLVADGFEKVYSLNGGILAWEGASLPLTKK
jgi:rhodanese-related sulfurtransferase